MLKAHDQLNVDARDRINQVLMWWGFAHKKVYSTGSEIRSTCPISPQRDVLMKKPSPWVDEQLSKQSLNISHLLCQTFPWTFQCIISRTRPIALVLRCAYVVDGALRFCDSESSSPWPEQSALDQHPGDPAASSGQTAPDLMVNQQLTVVNIQLVY